MRYDILVVHRKARFLSASVERFQSKGYVIRVVTSPEDALAECLTFNPRVIISGLILGHGNWEKPADTLLERLGREFSKIPVVVYADENPRNLTEEDIKLTFLSVAVALFPPDTNMDRVVEEVRSILAR